ncbi:translational activator of GCN4 [Coemansia erecta]|nr:translational activator of GCN4 [Coemansia erecta]KAJ2888951.1 translational activator of GCN4 [Coemansia asiatica]
MSVEAVNSKSDGFSWKGFLNELNITASGINERKSLIDSKLLPAISAHPIEDRELVQIIVSLKPTIELYVDKQSRELVLQVLRELAAKKASVFVKAIAGVLDAEVESAQPKTIGHPDSIPSVVAKRFVLLSWINEALVVPVVQLKADPETLAGDAAWKHLVVLAARLLWGVAPAGPKARSAKHASISSSAHHGVWRMLRGCPSVIGPMLSVLLDEAASSEFAAVLMGNIISTAVRLRSDQKENNGSAVDAVEKVKEPIVAFIDKVLIGSKTPVSYSSVADMRDFLRFYVGGEFEKQFKATISKMLLRSPEVVLPTCLWLLQSLDAETVDLSAIYLGMFADQLASNLIKSSNASVRQTAVQIFALLSNTPTTAEAAAKAADIATKPLIAGRYTQAEQRTEMYRLLGNVRAGPGNGWASAAAIVPALLKMTGKETVDQPVRALFFALGKQFRVLLRHLSSDDAEGRAACIDVVKGFCEAAKKGLALPDRSAVLRLAWAADAVGEPLWQVGASAIDGHGWAKEHVAPLVAALAAIAQKTSGSPLAAAGGTLDAHVGVALALRPSSEDDAGMGEKMVSLVAGPEKSLLLWDKAFHKCTGDRESLWLLRSAQMLYARGCNDARIARLLMWVICEFPEPRRQTAGEVLQTLRQMAAPDSLRLWTLVGPSVISCLAAQKRAVGRSSWHDVLVAAAGGQCSDKMQLLVDMALAAHYPAAATEGRQGSLWISLTQRLSVDPGELCADKISELLQTVRASMADGPGAEDRAAALALVRDLVFIGGESVARRVLEFAHSDIDPEALQAISTEDLAIWRTPADELFNDPVADKESSQQQKSKNMRGKTPDDVWAEQLRQELARKNNEKRKLTREEQELVDRQRAHEAAVRESVELTRCALSRGLALARAVVEGSSAVGSACMLELVRIVVERAILGGARSSEQLAGEEVLETLVALSTCAEGLEPTLRLPLAMGLLRTRGFERVVPVCWLHESLEDLATRIYFRLRVSCELSPLPSAGFNFLFPFMQATADAGGWGKRVKRGVEEHDEYAQMDHAAEQLTMVVDLLGFHAHFGGDIAMPRREMLDLMIFLMATQQILLPLCRSSLVRLAEEMEGSDTPLERNALLAGLEQPDSAVRSACLAALDFVDLTELDYAKQLWVNVGSAGAPALDDNSRAARLLWDENGLEVLPALIDDVVPYLNNASGEIRDGAARSIALAIEDLAEQDSEDIGSIIDTTLATLQQAYRKWYISLEPEYDSFGIVVPGTQNRKDIADTRVAVGSALVHLAPLLTSSAQVQSLVSFLVRDRVLGERSEAVRARMLEAGAQAVATHGGKWAADLMPILEQFLGEPDEGTHAYDCIREGVVVLLGRLAQHLPADDQRRVSDAVDRLVEALSTPSESVQRAVSECLPPLARRISEEKQALVVEDLLERTLKGEKYAVRRGGAYGIAGIIKGLGLASLKKFNVVGRLRAACENKKEPHERQGALFAFETMSKTLGRLFEPYVIQFVPLLLVLFGDASPDVREAALDTARVIMANISGHGVKLIMPAALEGLADDQWRIKKGSVEILGAMAFCAPKQLSLALPAIVPRIVTVLADSHGQVAAAARAALLRFGDVIHNPEIQALVPTLMAALDDPAAKTNAALVQLLHTAFVHYIDAPSLALVVPILQRGMRSRAASAKRNAAQIMGAMATLTEPNDLAPYLDELMPLVRGVLIDPVPEARATAAKALGSLVQRLGEERFPSLVADLIRILKSDVSGVDRAGAAQGLSEVLAGVGIGRLEGLLPEIVANCSSSLAAVREGFVLLLIFLPTTFGDDFRPFLPQVVPSVLSTLADDSELVRSAALRAGRILVVSYASGEGIDLLLPALLGAIHNDAWRIRHSAVELLGELLLRVAGISGKQAERDREAARALIFAKQNTADDEADEADAENDAGESDGEAEEDAAIASNLREILSQKLGLDRCQAVLAALYVARSDVSAMVRQISFTVWKSLVNNTPRTVRECLPRIMDIVLIGLAAESFDRRTTAARTLGDLVHKLGEAVMSRVVPILERALDAPDASESQTGSIRHGVFIGLSEILNSAGKLYVDMYADAMVPLVRRGLCDADSMVREAAASAFNALQQTAGPRVIDMIVPPLLNALQDDSSPYALDALRELMAVRANVVFPVLIPTLTKVPVTAFNARALSALIQVAGASLSKRLPAILRALFDSMPARRDDEAAALALHETVRVIVSSAAQDEDTLESLMLEFHECVKVPKSCNLAQTPDVASRISEACFAVEAMCQTFGPNSSGRGRSVLGPHVVDWLRILIDLLGAPSASVVHASWSALDSLCKTIPKEDFDGYVGPISRAVQQVTDALSEGQTTLPGFNLPKGLGPLLPIYAQGLLTGSTDTKERAVRGMARMVKFTEPSALRLYATVIAGPLIRIVGDRNPANVKAAILSTLGLLLTQIPAFMRPFLPQLQRTFVRGLSETDDVVRQRAAAALAALIPLQPRLDPLVSELTAGIRQTEDLGMKLAMLRAIRAVVCAPNATSLSSASFQAIEDIVCRADSSASSDLRWRSLVSKTFGALCSALPVESANKLIAQNAVLAENDSADTQAAKLSFMASALSSASQLFEHEMQQHIVDGVQTVLQSSSGVDRGQAALQAVAVAKNALIDKTVLQPGSPIVKALVDSLVRVVDPQTMTPYDTDVQHAALAALKSLSKHRFSEVIEPMRDSVVLVCLAHVRDRVVTVKLAAERCLLYSLRLVRVPKEGFDGNNAGLDRFVENMGGAASEKGKLALDYHRRVLSKLAESTRELDYASDDEDDVSKTNVADLDDQDS